MGFHFTLLRTKTLKKIGRVKRRHLHANPSVQVKNPSCSPLLYSFVCVVTIICYLNGLNGDFVHDDIPAVTLNNDVLAVNPLYDLLKNDFWGLPMSDVASHKSYRPLTTLSFRANYLIFGLQPLWFHAINVALHITVCVLVIKTLTDIAGLHLPFAALAGLSFAVHPIHTEAVTGIVGRADVLACIFFLASLLTYHGYSPIKYNITVSIILGGFSMLAKETGITVFIVNLGYDLYLHWPNVKRSCIELKLNAEVSEFLKRVAKIIAAVGLLVIIRLAILQGSFPKFSKQDNPAAFHPVLSVRFLTFCFLTAFNWWLVLCPATLSHDWQMGSVPLVTSVTDSRNIVTCFFFSLTILLAARTFIDFEYQRHPPIVLGFMLTCVPFLPATNLLVTVGFVVAERLLYIPSIGVILLVTYGFQMLWYNYSNQRQTLATLMGLLLISGCLRTISRNRDWRSRESLLRAGLMTLPHNAKMHYNYANFLRDSASMELAKAHYYRALKLWPSYASAHNNLGTLLSNETEAEWHFRAAISYSAEHVNAHYNLGHLYRKIKRTSESERMLQKCIQLEPRFIPAYIELAKLRGPHNEMVLQVLNRLLELSPSFYSITIGDWLLEHGNYKAAQYYYWKSMRLIAVHEEAVLGLAKLMRKFGQKSRLFQLITRWHFIRRIRRGEPPSSMHVYLQNWKLQHELTGMAKAYSKMDIYRSTPINSHEQDLIQLRSTDKGQRRNSSVNIVTNESETDGLTETGLSSPFMVHHLTDSA